MDLNLVKDDVRYRCDRRKALVILAENILDKVVQRYDCCSFWTVSLSGLSPREKRFLGDFLPGAKTAVVVGHHVVTKEEWTWHATANGGEHCAADDHTRDVCLKLREALITQGFSAELVPYPGESGLQFRFVAQSAGAGKIGKNAFLLHPQWGPWIHLRVLATRAPTRVKSIRVASVCNDCGVCVSACPAGAIQDKAFNGLRCRRYRKAKGEYTPVGYMQELRWCIICADVCPIGPKPVE
jgi:epoxyqueuosine reductase